MPKKKVVWRRKKQKRSVKKNSKNVVNPVTVESMEERKGSKVKKDGDDLEVTVAIPSFDTDSDSSEKPTGSSNVSAPGSKGRISGSFYTAEERDDMKKKMDKELIEAYKLATSGESLDTLQIMHICRRLREIYQDISAIWVEEGVKFTPKEARLAREIESSFEELLDQDDSDDWAVILRNKSKRFGQ